MQSGLTDRNWTLAQFHFIDGTFSYFDTCTREVVVSVKDIATLAWVSHATVSRALGSSH